MSKEIKKKKAGRPQFEITEDVLKKAEKYAGEGLWEWQIAKKLKICERTLIRKKKQYSQFCQAIKKGQDARVVKVENALFKEALTPGMTSAKIFFLKKCCKEKWGDDPIEVNQIVNVSLEEALDEALERKRKNARSAKPT